MTIHVSILAFDGCMGMEVFGLCDTLLLANRVGATVEGPAAADLFKLSVISVAGPEVTAAGGVRIGAPRAPRVQKRRPDLLIVPGMDVGDRDGCLQSLARLAPEIAFIASAFARGTSVASVCVGAFLLGEAGLLDARRATTSWLFAPDLARRFPRALVDPAAMLVEDGGVTTTGSFSAAFDLALHLISRAASPRVLRAVARVGLLDSGRASQSPYSDSRMLPRRPDTFASKVMTWLEQHLATPYDLDAIAAVFHVSARTLLRRFKQEAGITPLSHLQQARIGQARLLLETTSDSLARITEKVGYMDAATFGALFRRLVGQSPAEYRRRFKAPPAQK